MTIASRRRIYWLLFLVACAALVASFVLGLPLLSPKADFSSLEASGAYHVGSFLGLAVDSARISDLGIMAIALYSCLCLAFILGTFRKTVSSEIFFFSFWVLSLGFEVLRLVVFHSVSGGYPVSNSMLATRLVVGMRITGLLSFFAAGLYAAGFRNEKLGSSLAVIFLAAWTLAYSMPMDTGALEQGFMLRPGYRGLAVALAVVLGVATIANFFYASFTTGEASYRVVALGAGLALAGEGLVLVSWLPLAVGAGVVLLMAGSWLLVSRLHAYYLWQ